MALRACTLSLLIATTLLGPAMADDVTDQINEALTAYSKKDVTTAIAGLEAAVSLLRQRKAELYGKALPPVPPGWHADNPETSATAGLALLGGGVGVSRKYYQGDDTVTVSILADSPMLQMVAAFTSGPMAGMAGMQTQIISGRRTTYQKDDNAFMTVVAERILVRVQGSHGVPDSTLKPFLAAVDFAAIEAASK